MGEHSDSIMFNDYTKAAFEGFKSHFNNHRTSTELSMLEHLRETHADYHVTCTTPTRCDLHGFAKAELATMALDNTYLLDTTRVYKIPQTRLSGEPGILRNQIRFACWNLTWNSSAYIVYEIEYETESPFSPPKRLFFILSPRTTTTEEGTSSSTDELLLSVGAWSSALHDEIWVFDEGAWSKSRELYESVQSASWSDVILNPATKNSLITDITSFFSSRDLYKNLAVPWKRGLIFHGVPGNGKTISIKALINELGQREDSVPSLYVKNFDACQGEKYSIKEIFAQARGMAPCLLVFEDLDSLVTDETRSYFLNEVDGLESNDGILMIGSTNHLSALDPAISKRPSRFDRKYHFKLPSLSERTAYCNFWRGKLTHSYTTSSSPPDSAKNDEKEGEDESGIDFPEELCEIVAKMSEGFSFAYLKEMFVITLLTIARGGDGEDVEVEEQKKEEAAPTTEASRNEDGKTSDTDAPVMVEHADGGADKEKEAGTTERSGEDKEKESIAKTCDCTCCGATKTPTPSADAKKPKDEAPKKRRTIPEVEISDHLKDNVLLKVIRNQLRVLMDEMDNTKEEDWPSEKKQGLPGAKMRRGMRYRPGACF